MSYRKSYRAVYENIYQMSSHINCAGCNDTHFMQQFLELCETYESMKIPIFFGEFGLGNSWHIGSAQKHARVHLDIRANYAALEDEQINKRNNVFNMWSEVNLSKS